MAGSPTTTATPDLAVRVPATVELSVLLPSYNEADNLLEVVPRLFAVLDALPGTHEVLIIDDGSGDATREVVEGLRRTRPELVHYLRLRRNFGKSTALQAGFEHARGRHLVLMDADGQDQPEEIPRLLEALDGGLDLATGSREERDDRFVKRTTSKLYNAVTRIVTGVEGRDFNSGLKAMRREVVEPMSLYGELHRYIPVLAQWAGFRVGEVAVEHKARLHGTSKFGRARFWRGFLDLITIKFITTYTSRPFHLFGGIGLLFGTAGLGLLTWMLLVKIGGDAIGTRPAFFTGILLVVVGVQLVTLGLLAELIVYFRRDRGTDAIVLEERG